MRHLCILFAALALVQAEARATVPADFFCRPLSDAGSAALAQSLFSASLTWDPKVRERWKADKDLQAQVLRQFQDTLGTPYFFKGGAGSCGPNDAARAQGTCQQRVECTFVPFEVQKQVEESYSQLNQEKLAFASIDSRSKEKFLAAVKPAALDWKMATVTCAGSGELKGVGQTCPPPDLCKNDVEHDGAAAGTDPRARGSLLRMGVNTPDAGGTTKRAK